MFNNQQFEVMLLTTFKQVQRYWPLFRESLNKLNELTNDPVSEETYLRAVMDAMVGRGIVPMWKRSGEGDIQALGIAMDTTNPYHPPSLLIYAFYSVHGDPYVTKAALSWLEDWGRAHGYKELQAWSPRINGSAFWLFEKKWGFRRRSIYFTKSI